MTFEKKLLKTSKIVFMYSNSLARHFSPRFHTKCLLLRLNRLLPVRSCLKYFYQCRITALVESQFWNPAELFSFISFHNHFKIFRYDELLTIRVMFCHLSLLSYSEMTSEPINKQSFKLLFEILFQLQIELEANLLDQNVNELQNLNYLECRLNQPRYPAGLVLRRQREYVQ